MREYTAVKSTIPANGSFVVKTRSVFITSLIIQNLSQETLTIQLDDGDGGLSLNAGLILDFETDIPKNKITLKNDTSVDVDVVIWRE